MPTIPATPHQRAAIFRRQQGLTLVELLIVVAVLGVLLGVALPTWRDSIAATRAGAAQSHLLAAVTRAVQAAATTSQHVVLCPSEDGEGCADSFDWSSGWVVFGDWNGNRVRDGSERLILVEPAIGEGARLMSTTGRRRLVIQPSGGIAGSNVTFTLCDARGPARARSLVFNNAGRMRLDEPNEARRALACEGL